MSDKIIKVDSVVTDGEPVAAEEPGETLGQLAKELCYFTPALLMTHGKFDRDPLFEFNNRCWNPDADLRPFAIDTPKPMFQNLGITLLGRDEHQERVNWDHRLYAIHRSRFEELQKFLTAISFQDRDSKLFATVGAHVLQIVDVTALGGILTSNDIPTVNITVFCISTNKEFVHMAPAVDPPRTRPYAICKPPTREAILMANAVFGPPPDPEAAFR